MSARGIPLDTALTASTFVETFLFGTYTFLYAKALPVMLRANTRGRSQNFSLSRIYPWTISLMYIVATVHAVLSVYRFYRAYIAPNHPNPGSDLFDAVGTWDATMNTVLVVVMTWIGDALVIYRCYHIWNNRLSLVILPILLLLGSFAVNTYVLVWFQDPFKFSRKSRLMSSNAIYPLALIQNIMTTGLIILKIWIGYRQSTDSGVVDRGSGLNLLKIFRIIIESAMLYTIQLFILMILFFLNDNSQWIMQDAIVPSIGIVFVLITLRIDHARRQDAEVGTSFNVPSTWVVERNSVIAISQLGTVPAHASSADDQQEKAESTSEELADSQPTLQ